MAPEKRMKRLRDAGISPTIQRLAILEYLEKTRNHPTADEVYAEVRRIYPTIARATVYNTLEALTKAGTILRLTIDPAASRYDADLEPHIHFRCRVCGALLDLPARKRRSLAGSVNGHRVESVRTYAYGVCADCLSAGERTPATSRDQQKTASPASATDTSRREGLDGTKPPASSPATSQDQQKTAPPASASDTSDLREEV